jgi:RNA polymerase sigma factor for flagellar operon FliA
MESHAEPVSSEACWWQEWRGSGDARAREKLLELHLPYTRVVAAAYYARRYSDDIEFGEYLQYASVGMLEAMERYDPQRGVQFRTFAARRMHGAILNGLERLTEKQQQIAARQRLRAERLQDVRECAGEAAGGGQSPEQLMRFVSEVGIGLAVCWMLEGTAMVEDPAGTSSIPFYQSAQLRQMREKLVQAVDRLPPQERTVIRHHYLQEVPFERIACDLQLTKGRISQIHKQALLHLRRLLGAPADWDVIL